MSVKTRESAAEPAGEVHGVGLDRCDIANLGEPQHDARLSNA
jgi:hypothetical protein